MLGHAREPPDPDDEARHFRARHVPVSSGAQMRHPTTPGYGQILGAVTGDPLRQAGAPEELGILLANPSTLAPRRRSANPSPPRRDLGCWYAPLEELSCQ